MIIILFFANNSVALEKNRPLDDDNCKKIGKSVETCTPYKCTMKYPNDETFILTHHVKGLTKDGKCHHTQTIPEGIIICNYGKEAIKIVSKMHSGKRLTKEEGAVARMAFTLECEVKENSK